MRNLRKIAQVRLHPPLLKALFAPWPRSPNLG
jgi:hypothetical protein